MEGSNSQSEHLNAGTSVCCHLHCQIYKNENGVSKGEATLTYEEANSAHAAIGFFHNTKLNGKKIKVSMAKYDYPDDAGGGGGGGGGGYGGGGETAVSGGG